MATSDFFARLAGVSRATVSRVLNGSTRVSAEARAHVYAAIASLTHNHTTGSCRHGTWGRTTAHCHDRRHTRGYSSDYSNSTCCAQVNRACPQRIALIYAIHKEISMVDLNNWNHQIIEEFRTNACKIGEQF
jgi:hypothetical protein